MLNRFKIHKCLNQIRRDVNADSFLTGDKLDALYAEYSDVIPVLIDLGCIDVKYEDDKPYFLSLKNHAYTYRLERSEVWLNRIGGFLCGVIATILAEILSAWILTML